jgi:hypothetical protein
MAMKFDGYIGIDYSGAKTAEHRLPGLQAYRSEANVEPRVVRPAGSGKNWSRAALANWLLDQLHCGGSMLIGIDHCFSFPLSYFERYELDSWPAFLDDFCRHWPTDQPGCTVDSIRNGSWWCKREKPRDERTGTSHEFRLCERWTSSAKSVFQFDMQGTVAKSSHTGSPWLRYLRENIGDELFFWPFDGWEPSAGVSVIAEVYPSVFRNRYDRAGRSVDEHDAYSVARWLADSDRQAILAGYFNPPLTAPERRVAAREGWILGIS